MKKFILILGAVVACVFAFTSCDGKAESTPGLELGYKCYRTTLAGRSDTVFVTDTFNVGDTVRVFTAVSGGMYYNTLVSFTALCDTAALDFTLECDSAIYPYLTAESDVAHGKLVFKPEQVFLCTMWMRFTPRKSGSHKIEMTVANNASAEYSPRTWSYIPAVR